MTRYLLAAAAALTLSTGSVLAQGTDTNMTGAAPSNQPVAAASPYYGYVSGYVFPNDGSPSGDQDMARSVVPQQGPGLFSRIYLYPPSEGSDSGNGAG